MQAIVTKNFIPQNLTADLEKYVKTSEADLPEVLLSICYNATISRLTVNVVEGKNVKVGSEINRRTIIG